jgi:hypothetical protein
MRRSLGSDEDLGAEAPTALRGTLLKSAEAYHGGQAERSLGLQGLR